MRVLVTGSSGFLGTHVAKAFLEDGADVSAYDLRTTDVAGIKAVQGDLLDKSALESAAGGHDVICHIGAIGDVYLAADQPDLAASVNVTGSANVGLVAEAVGCRVLYASTWEVYGEPDFEPVDESHPCRPDHPYNISKLAGEQMLLAADHLRGVPVTALRLGTAYGLGMRPNSVFEIFIRKAQAGEPLTIQGDGNQGRQFTHSADIASAFVKAAHADTHGHAMNIVSPKVVTIKELAEAVIDRYPTEVTFGDPRPGDVAPSMVSADLAKKTLGWSAQVSFADGMAELLAADRG